MTAIVSKERIRQEVSDLQKRTKIDVHTAMARVADQFFMTPDEVKRIIFNTQ